MVEVLGTSCPFRVDERGERAEAAKKKFSEHDCVSPSAMTEYMLIDFIRRRSTYRYPVVYSILILPLSIVRWIGFGQERGNGVYHIGAGATFAVISIYGLSGLMNVILLLLTRPNSLLFGKGDFDVHDVGRPPPTSPSLGSLPNDGSDWHINGLHPGRDEMSERVRGSEGGLGLELGRLPSRSDDGWDLPRSLEGAKVNVG